MKINDLYGRLQLTREMLALPLHDKIFNFLTNEVQKRNLTYDWRTDKLTLMITFINLEGLTELEDFLEEIFYEGLKGMLDISMDTSDSFVLGQMTYRLYYTETSAVEKQFLLKLFPAKHLVEI